MILNNLIIDVRYAVRNILVFNWLSLSLLKKTLFIPIGKVIFFLLKSLMSSIIFYFSSSEICDKNLYKENNIYF